MKKIISYLKTNKNVVKYLTDEDQKILKPLIISVLGVVVVTQSYGSSNFLVSLFNTSLNTLQITKNQNQKNKYFSVY